MSQERLFTCSSSTQPTAKPVELLMSIAISYSALVKELLGGCRKVSSTLTTEAHIAWLKESCPYSSHLILLVELTVILRMETLIKNPYIQSIFARYRQPGMLNTAIIKQPLHYAFGFQLLQP